MQAARVSYGEGTKRVSDDRTLHPLLMRHRHTTPFEMARSSLDLAFPWTAGVNGSGTESASVNEYSTRYSIAIDAAKRRPTSGGARRKQSTGERQRRFPRSVGKDLSSAEARLLEECRRVYQERLDRGVAREQARKDLPLSTYTEAYWKIDLHNLLHFLLLRMDDHAQKEIRDYASTIGQQIVALLVSDRLGSVSRLSARRDGADPS